MNSSKSTASLFASGSIGPHHHADRAYVSIFGAWIVLGGLPAACVYSRLAFGGGGIFRRLYGDKQRCSPPKRRLAMVAAGDIDMGFTFVEDKSSMSVLLQMAEISAPIGVVMRADDPLANKLAVDFDELSRYPILTQTGPLPKGADADVAFAAFKSEIKPKLLVELDRDA